MNTIERAAWLKTLTHPQLLALAFKACLWETAKGHTRAQLYHTLAPVKGLEIPTKG